MLHRIIANLPEPRDLFRLTLAECFASNPESTSRIVLLMALYLDVGPFSRNLVVRTERIIEALHQVSGPRMHSTGQASYERPAC
jgi:hypothetical protein